MSSGENELKLSAIQERTEKRLWKAAHEEERVLIEAPPASGKTTSTVKMAGKIDRPVVYLTERRNLYEQAEKTAEEYGVDAVQIPSPFEDCEAFNQKQKKVLELYKKGYTAKGIHGERFDIDLRCGGEGECEYHTAIQRISAAEGETDQFDLLIGNHVHAQSDLYIEDRVVVFDEFNADQFLKEYPREGGSGFGKTPPMQLIGEFLEDVQGADEPAFPDELADATDIIQARADEEIIEQALQWFTDHGGVTRGAVKEMDFYTPNSYKYDNSAYSGPLLTFGLLCMRKTASGFARAPPTPDAVSEATWDGVNPVKIHEAWNETQPSPGTRVVRDRNSGAMYILKPPDLGPAAQVIALDAFPTKELWDLVFAPDVDGGFNRRPIVDRADLPAVRDQMDIELYRTDDKSVRYYSGGRIKDRDIHDLAVVYSEEGQYPMISTNAALEQYNNRGWLGRYVQQKGADPDQTGETDIFEDIDEGKFVGEFAALNFSNIRGTNAFEDRSVGFVSGAPHPGDDVIRLWTTLYGDRVEVNQEDSEDNRRYEGEVANNILSHFSHNQVMQAVFRFGRDEETQARVYINTAAVPDWCDPTELSINRDLIKDSLSNSGSRSEEYTIEDRFNILKFMREWGEKSRGKKYKELHKYWQSYDIDKVFDGESGPEISSQHIGDVLRRLEKKGLVKPKRVNGSIDRGKGDTKIYYWAGESKVEEIPADNPDRLSVAKVDEQEYYVWKPSDSKTDYRSVIYGYS